MADHEFYQVRKITREARQLKKEKKFDEAREVLEEGLADYPDNNYLKTSLADLLIRINRLQDAANLAQEVLSDNPQNWQALTVKGNIAYNKRNYKQAREFYQQAYDIKQNKFVASKLINVYIELEQYEKALDLCQQWLEREPDHDWFKKQKASIYEKMDKSKKARELYDAYLEDKPEDEFAYKEKIKIMIRDKEPEAAVKQLQQLLKIGERQQNIHLHTLLAEQLEELDRYEEAVSEYKKALSMQPGDNFTLKQLGFCLKKMGEEEEALTYLQQVFVDDPGDFYVRSTLMSLFKKLNKRQQGIEYFKKVMRENQGYNNLWGMIKKLASDLQEKESE